MSTTSHPPQRLEPPLWLRSAKKGEIGLLLQAVFVNDYGMDFDLEYQCIRPDGTIVAYSNGDVRAAENLTNGRNSITRAVIPTAAKDKVRHTRKVRRRRRAKRRAKR